jgi:geranylgeranylglycerol-phosphate geranylgeranyltransferase
MKTPPFITVLFPVIVDFTKHPTTRHISFPISHVRIPLSTTLSSRTRTDEHHPKYNHHPCHHDGDDFLQRRDSSSLFVKDSSIHESNANEWRKHHRGKEFFQLMRPFTLLQAVGALLVGCLAIRSSTFPATTAKTVGTTHAITHIILACISVYLSYGTGMVMNDCVDSTTDAMHEQKRHRPLASGRVSVREAWIFSAGLATASLIIARICSTSFAIWTLSNLLIMLLYAFGLQKLFLVKNMIVGWLGVSPLVGAQLLMFRLYNDSFFAKTTNNAFWLNPELVPLAVVGFGVGMAREILKDLEDVDVDRVAGKQTLPHIVGNGPAHRLAFAMALACCVACWTFPFRVDIFRSHPIYIVSLWIGTAMVARASWLPLSKGQTLLKRTIYVLLAGMIGSFWIQLL